ncbi:site-specific integrase [Polynucleobacter sp. AP-Capit-er-40B-B4]|uniref:tyrosine-type recombinase/integrase n=1 Tax=Polynucleobacter sp. AP-Capit-er-40B-B4 TaxID=2576927 RepID=UPI001C0B4997|nr:phage integrase SAM-like domain-containing protein [Polynucleobacter sp. AP-Capit-er-40B-B4]MBU3581201.1 site-specific integrase [Polynucleobacter sp. AP-Capit-er-40B-B4]
MIFTYTPSSNNSHAANDDCAHDSYGKFKPFDHKASNSAFKISKVKHPLSTFETFSTLAEKALDREIQKHIAGDITKQTLGMFRSRLRAMLLPYFGKFNVAEIRYEDIAGFINYLYEHDIKPVTIKQYLGLLRRILVLALEKEIILKVPLFPKIKAKSIPRGSFTCTEYRKILSTSRAIASSDQYIITSHRSTSGGAYIKRETVPREMTWLIQFMVNSFVRPVDIKLIQHKHIETIVGNNTYLRLNLPKTKGHTGQIVTLRSAKYIYDRLKRYQLARGYGSPNDYLFLPEAKDRQGAIQLISNHFRKILASSGLSKGQEGQTRTLYSLRHTAITFRLLYGKGIDLLTLARNARTSVEMIERFYSSNLTAEMNIEMLQSKRTTVNVSRTQFYLSP